jgi:DnaJ family protein C protein 3
LLIQTSYVFIFHYTVHGNANPSEIEKHLELGKLMMAKGQLQDALTHFHAALEGDPSNHLTLYRRATVYLAQGRARAALEDLNRVLEIQPDFIQARAQKGNILMKLGRLHKAHIELEKVVSIHVMVKLIKKYFLYVYLSQLKKEPTNSEVNKNYIAIESLKKSYMQAQMFFSDKDYHHAIDLLTQVIDVCFYKLSCK